MGQVLVKPRDEDIRCSGVRIAVPSTSECDDRRDASTMKVRKRTADNHCPDDQGYQEECINNGTQEYEPHAGASSRYHQGCD